MILGILHSSVHGLNGVTKSTNATAIKKISDRKFVALSHCWGATLPGKVPSYCTTKENIGDRETEFLITDLPVTFQDAIEVTRQLGLRYIWIDSLCIIQGKEGDWEKEAKSMEDVYTSAYCTLAATSAVDSSKKLLERTINSEYICIRDNTGRRVYICTNPADFDTDVERAQLNTRAWVMQERLLSCRTIHFGTNQTYWECGEGVYCEDLTKLTSPMGNKHFRLDPQFPHLLQRSGAGSTINFLQSLLDDYSRRGLSSPTDRAVALSGLAARIATALNCKAEYGYGAFGFFLHRSLLWQRTDLQKKRIQYETGKEVPSWSWMAYEGGIRFIQFAEIPFGGFEVFKYLRFAQEDTRDDEEKKVLLTKVWAFKGCFLNREATLEGTRCVLGLSGAKRGWIMFDGKEPMFDGEEDLHMQRAVVIAEARSSKSPDDNGRPNGREYHILVVEQREGNKYERVGIGRIQQDCVTLQDADVFII